MVEHVCVRARPEHFQKNHCLFLISPYGNHQHLLACTFIHVPSEWFFGVLSCERAYEIFTSYMHRNRKQILTWKKLHIWCNGAFKCIQQTQNVRIKSVAFGRAKRAL